MVREIRKKTVYFFKKIIIKINYESNFLKFLFDRLEFKFF